MARPRAPRDAYAVFRPMTTRWRDNDVYGHINNVVYYEFVDSAVNGWLRDSGVLLVPGGPVIGLVVETSCTYHESLAFPDAIEAGIAVHRIGTSSVKYAVGIFRAGAERAAAEARFVHVYVDTETRRPRPLDDTMRAGLAKIVV